MRSFEKRKLLSKFNGNRAADVVEIERFQRNQKYLLPTDYAQFLQEFDGGEGFIGEGAYVIFWRLSQLAEMNEAYQIEKYAPGFFIFGSDGGGEAYAFDTRNSAEQIVSIPFIGMDPHLARPLAQNFTDFLQFLAIDPVLVRVGRSFDLSWWQMAGKIHLPALIEPVRAGLRLGLSAAIGVCLIAEIKFSRQGLGAMMIDSFNRSRFAEVYAVLIVIIAIAIAGNRLVDRLGRQHRR